MTGLLVALGLVLVAVALLDLAWTTIAAGSGAGPITGRVAATLWRGALVAHRRRPRHRLLSVAGVAIVFAVLAVWIALALAGWALVFASTEAAVRDSRTGEPVDLGSRLYFTGYSLFTLGNGDLRPGRGWWQLATVAATGTGLVLVTLAITYLVPVASAVAQRRQLASYIASLGPDPHQIVVRSWDGGSFGSLSQHLVGVTALVHDARQQHLTYPVLHYFHSEEPESAAPLNLVNLSQALHLLRTGVAPHARPDPAATGPLDLALGSFLATVRRAYLDVDLAPVAPPDLAPLRAAGIPVVDADAYHAAEPASRHRRALLASLLADDGWTPGRAQRLELDLAARTTAERHGGEGHGGEGHGGDGGGGSGKGGGGERGGRDSQR